MRSFNVQYFFHENLTNGVLIMKITEISNGTTRISELSVVTDECPLCHSNISPVPIVMSGNKYKSAAMFLCPNNNCGNFFISYYNNGYYNGSYPKLFSEQIIPDSVREISASFVQLYNEAKQAESASLMNIYGVGLRKALEFLIKDYCINENPDISDEIKSETLAICIKKHIDDHKIKECASRAAWIGNDETHYERKWTNKDAADLDDIIKLTVAWIDFNLRTKKLLSEMGR